MRAFAVSKTRNKDDADDLVQETLLKAIEKEDQFEVGTNMVAWLVTILRNTYYDRVRSHAVSRTDSIEEMEAGFDIETPGVQVTTVEISELNDYIDGLPETEQEMIRMTAEEMSSQQIADALNMSVVNTRTRLCRLRKEMYRRFHA